MSAFGGKALASLVRAVLLAGVSAGLLLMLGGLAASSSALLRAGVLVLLLTPAARVAALVYGYWRRGEHYFSLASFVVLAMLAVSMLIG